MKEEINLLPADVLKKRARLVYSKRLGRLSWFLMIGLVLINLSLVAINFSLRDSLKVVSQENKVVEGSDSNTVVDQTRDINELTKDFKAKTAEYEPWLPLIKDIIDVKPENTSVVSLSLIEDEKEQSLSLKAQSSSRSEVVAWQEALGNLEWVEKVEAPLQNFATGPNSTFNFTLYRGEE